MPRSTWNDGVLVAPFELKNGNSVIKLKNLNYGVIYLEATSTDSGTVQDFTGMTHMVMDVWSKNGASKLLMETQAFGPSRQVDILPYRLQPVRNWFGEREGGC